MNRISSLLNFIGSWLKGEEPVQTANSLKIQGYPSTGGDVGFAFLNKDIDKTMHLNWGHSSQNAGIFVEDNGWLVRCDASTGKKYITTIDVDSLIHTAKVARGHVALSSAVAANSYADVNVNFGKTFAGTPTVVAGLQSASTSATTGQLSVAVLNVTSTGFDLRVFNGSSSQKQPGVEYIAMYF